MKLKSSGSLLAWQPSIFAIERVRALSGRAHHSWRPLFIGVCMTSSDATAADDTAADVSRAVSKAVEVSRDSRLADRESELQERERELRDREKELRAREARIAEREAKCADREASLATQPAIGMVTCATEVPLQLPPEEPLPAEGSGGDRTRNSAAERKQERMRASLKKMKQAKATVSSSNNLQRDVEKSRKEKKKRTLDALPLRKRCGHASGERAGEGRTAHRWTVAKRRGDARTLAPANLGKRRNPLRHGCGAGYSTRSTIPTSRRSRTTSRCS